MLSDKIWDLKFANFVLRNVRKSINGKRRVFRCVKNTSVRVDEFTGGAHIVEVSKSEHCDKFNRCKKCKEVCPNHDWNNSYIDLLGYLRDARHERNLAIINLFFVTRKGAQLAKYVWLKASVAKLFKAYDVALDKLSGMKSNDPQYDKAVEDKRQKEIAYDNAVQQMNVARAKLWVSTK